MPQIPVILARISIKDVLDCDSSNGAGRTNKSSDSTNTAAALRPIRFLMLLRLISEAAPETIANTTPNSEQPK
jgi:hypothetical protein